MSLHEKDEFIKLSVPPYVAFVMGVGQRLSIIEINEEVRELHKHGRVVVIWREE
jgi:hypothetical protein